ncbi:MAG TPA: DegT/DnrJ/EryC1/StrS family aminotransferase [Blastocatellia bacterium]|nr:DegT/DnrJ/EryC1/StrS family aminotransferase [Blastocatellia bacterium]
MNNLPAVLGNDPVFATKINIVRPVLPSFANMAAETEGILTSGMVTKGRHLRAFEEAAAEHLGVRNAVAVSSCTTGLMLTYRCLGLTGDVIVPSFTFMATVSSLVWAGLRPVFADVNFGTTNLDPAAAESAITPDTTAIVAVHNFGNPADIDALEAVADSHGLRLIFDAAHGFGALYQGKPVGPQGDAHVYSLSPTKLLIAGEGGIVATDNDELADGIRMGREYGNSGNYDSAFAGINARMPEFNALMGFESLRNLERAARRRNDVAAIYHRELGELPGIGFQEVRTGNRNSYKDFSITVDADGFGLGRDDLALALGAENIDTRKYYEPPVHRQTAYQTFATNGELLDNTELLASRSLSLPMWSHMDDKTAYGVCRAIRRIHEFAAEVARTLNQSTTASAT